MMFTRPLEPCWNTMQAAPVRSSSITASLTESRFSVRLSRRTILETALVATQPLLDLGQRLIGAGIGVGGIGIGLERNSGIQMQRAVGAETEAILAQRDVAGILAVEIFAQHFIGALADTPAQRIADIDTFSRDAESHFDASIGLERGQYPESTVTQSSRRGVAGPVGRCGGRRESITEHALFVAAALYRGRDSHRLAVLRDRATGDINAGFAQSFHDGVVRQDHGGVFRIDQLLDVVADRLRRMGFAAVGRCNRGGEEILQFETAAI